jgi:glycosyltransferase involved in cell wall biosynthesis
VDVSIFTPRNKAFSRDCLGIPQEAKVLLFAAHTLGERRKGMSLLIEAIAGLRDVRQLHLLAVGGYSALEGLNIPYLPLGYISNERLLSIVYSAADVCVIPTLQDNLPNIAIESLACGTPVASFRVGGMPEIIRDGSTGLLAAPADIQGLRAAVTRLLEDINLRESMAALCRQTAVEEYSLDIQAQRYLSMYERLTGHVQPEQVGGRAAPVG